MFLYYYLGVNTVRLSSCERRPAPKTRHVSLTHWLRHHYLRTPMELRNILATCDVDPRIGALPPELVARLKPADVAVVTTWFRNALEEFLVDNGYALRTAQKDGEYDLPAIGAMFGTSCRISYRGAPGRSGSDVWRGAFGYVCKMSFPEIKCDYALKVYFSNGASAYGRHGPLYEIPTAFAAYAAEPRHNNPVYMASLFHDPYILSAWGGDDNDGWIRRNRYEIFTTRLSEVCERNYRCGRRIDFGDTFPTAYAGISYRARKIYRCIDRAWRRGGFDAVRLVVEQPHPYAQQYDVADGVRMFYYQYHEFLPPEMNALLRDNLNRCR